MGINKPLLLGWWPSPTILKSWEFRPQHISSLKGRMTISKSSLLIFRTCSHPSTKWSGINSNNSNNSYLVGAFNPSEKYQSKWVHPPQIRVENKKYLSCHHPVTILTLGPNGLGISGISSSLWNSKGHPFLCQKTEKLKENFSHFLSGLDLLRGKHRKYSRNGELNGDLPW